VGPLFFSVPFVRIHPKSPHRPYSFLISSHRPLPLPFTPALTPNDNYVPLFSLFFVQYYSFLHHGETSPFVKSPKVSLFSVHQFLTTPILPAKKPCTGALFASNKTDLGSNQLIFFLPHLFPICQVFHPSPELWAVNRAKPWQCAVPDSCSAFLLIGLLRNQLQRVLFECRVLRLFLVQGRGFRLTGLVLFGVPFLALKGVGSFR